MMQFKSKSRPPVSAGLSFKGSKKLTVPDQSMSLKEILQRFVRGESLPIDKGGEYHESEDDLEKLARMDLVDKAEYIEQQREVQKKYERQEKDKEKKRRESIAKEERERIAAEVRAEAEKTANNKP